MLKLTNLTSEEYFLPEDGELAKARFLDLLHNPFDTYISAYAFNFAPMLQDIVIADNAGVKFDIIIDHTQSFGQGEKQQVLDMCKQLKNSCLTITTAAAGSKKTQINHTKAMVVLTTPVPTFCEGSVNFSASGWTQANTFRVSNSQEWADQFIKMLKEHKDWARTNHPDWQIMSI